MIVEGKIKKRKSMGFVPALFLYYDKIFFF
jgi:hypothetical protein